MKHPLTWLFERPYPTDKKYIQRLKKELEIIKAKNFEETYSFILVKLVPLVSGIFNYKHWFREHPCNL